MRKYLKFILVLGAVLSLSACGAPADQTSVPAAPSATPAPSGAPLTVNSAVTASAPVIDNSPMIAATSAPALVIIPPLPASTPAGQAAPNQQNQAAIVVIKNFAFAPAVMTVNKGTTVFWNNEDPMAHQIKSATFNSQPLSTGDSFSFTFNTPGTFDYICAIHPSMTGTVVVK